MTSESQLVERLRKSCSAKPGRLALPEIADERVFKAACYLLQNGSVHKIYTLTKAAHLAKMPIPENQRVHFIPIEEVEDKVSMDQTYLIQAGELLQKGLVDAVVAGAVHTTAEVIRAAITTVGLHPGCRTVSGAFLMNRSETTYLYADCGVVPEPTPKQLDDIGDMTLLTWEKLMGQDIKPVVAFLSFSTHGSARHDRAEKVAKAAKDFAARHPEVDCDGEMQFDAAFDQEIGQRKCPGSKVPGRANCFIFPNLESGNIAYKITQRLGGFSAYGPILQGAGKPFSDLSRGASVEDIVVSSYINLSRANLG